MTFVFGFLGIVFVILKLTGAIGWSWWWVLSPFIFNIVSNIIYLSSR